MEAVGKHAAAKAKDTVDGSREPRADGFHSGCEISLARCLDDRMHVIVLDRVLDEPEAPPLARRSEAALELAHEADRAERRQPAPDLQGDMAGMTSRERRARTVIMLRARAALAARTRASSTPARGFAEIELELSNASHHDLQGDMQV